MDLQRLTEFAPLVMKRVNEIRDAYNDLGLGPFDNHVYQEIVARDIYSIEARYRNLYQESVDVNKMHSLDYGKFLFEKNAVFDKLTMLMPGLRELSNDFPINLIKIVNGSAFVEPGDLESLKQFTTNN